MPTPPTNPPEPSHHHGDHYYLSPNDTTLEIEVDTLYATVQCDYTVDYHRGTERVGPFREKCGHEETITYDAADAPSCPAETGPCTPRVDDSNVQVGSAADVPDTITIEGTCRLCEGYVCITYER